jgi:L-alanine-DL-glutamate epimerase-like enolase superfamily enzyme
MKLSYHEISMPLRRPFTISRESITSQRTLIVELSDQGESGYGEVTENSFYGRTIESIVESIEKVRTRVETLSLHAGDVVWSAVSQLLCKDPFALAALDIAAHDLYGRLMKRPCFELWGLEWENVQDSSLTIGLASVDEMTSRLLEQPGWSTYKIKIGVPHDVELVRALRRHTDACFRVDANCGWTVKEAIQKSRELRELGVEFIEQPLPPTLPLSDHQCLYSKTALPIVADESCCRESDLDSCAKAFHGINVKLCKCGGLTPALRIIQRAREKGLRTMVGCMIESSIGISAAAQLLPLLDAADLDGAIFLKDDPATGVILDRGVVSRPTLHGCGGRLKSLASIATVK